MSFRLGFNSISLILILVSFVFLLLATISSPVVKTFKLGETANYTYGVFGYCWNNNQDCFTGYPISLSQVDDSSSNWILSNSSRDTLAKILILIPIALGFNFILLLFTFITHFGSRPIVLISIVINVISLILTIISCIITILTFYPNLAWTAWILIGSAAANIGSLICLILTLMMTTDDDDDDQGSTFENEDFGRFTNYNQIDDKFNHIQSSNFKTNSSVDDEFDYKPNESNFNNFSNINSSQGQLRTGNTNNGKPNNSGGVAAAAAAVAVGTGAGAGAGSNIKNGYGLNGVPSSQRIVPPAQRMVTNGSLTSNSSSYYNKPQTVNDFTQRDPNTYGYQSQNSSTPTDLNDMVRGVVVPINNNNNNNNRVTLPYPAGTPIVKNNDKNDYDSSVFEHHPEVEGHKPFTELDDSSDIDIDIDDADEEKRLVNNNNNNHNNHRQGDDNGMNDSDEDSDFTSVSQRAPNPQYYTQGGGYQSQNQYSHVQQYTPLHQQPQLQQPQLQFQQSNQYRPMQYQQQQQYSPVATNAPGGPSSYYSSNQGQSPSSTSRGAGPTISDNVLNNNPDFQFSRLQQQQQKRKVNPGFVPVAARYNNNNNSSNGGQFGQKNQNQNASAFMGRGTGSNSGPYSITR